jgi:hypothetical protein
MIRRLVMATLVVASEVAQVNGYAMAPKYRTPPGIHFAADINFLQQQHHHVFLAGDGLHSARPPSRSGR